MFILYVTVYLCIFAFLNVYAAEFSSVQKWSTEKKHSCPFVLFIIEMMTIELRVFF